jgi:beta-glucanase (GH16 family)
MGMFRWGILCVLVWSGVAAASETRLNFQSASDIVDHFLLGTHTFGGNLAQFDPSHIQIKNNRATIYLDQRANPAPGERAYEAGEMIYSDATFSQGRLEARLKPNCVSGTVSGFFLYRADPWQELDVEFLGNQPTKVQTTINVNKGAEGDRNNEAKFLKVVSDLGFNACEDFHRYVIEWNAQAVRFYVDDRLIDERKAGEYELPNLPMSLRINLWPTNMDYWAGGLNPSQLPAIFEMDWLDISSAKENLPLSRNALKAYLSSITEW